MTHRSRAGGPPKNSGASRTKPKSKPPGPPKTHPKPVEGPRKLHHPPPRNSHRDSDEDISDDDDDEYLITKRILEFPDDKEILDVIRDSLKDTIEGSEFVELVQKVKGLLYEKKWLEVFETPEDLRWLEAYAGRWVPGRVLCFRELLGSVKVLREVFVPPIGNQSGSEKQITAAEEDEDDEEDEEDEEVDEDKDKDSEEDDVDGVESTRNSVPTGSSSKRVRFSNHSRSVDLATSFANTHLFSPNCDILSLGGGAGSEYLAIAAVLRATNSPSSSLPVPENASQQSSQNGEAEEEDTKWNWIGVDIGAWKGVLNSFEKGISQTWQIPLKMEYHQGNLLPLETSSSSSSPLINLTKIIQQSPPSLITILFTLTELLTQSRSSTLGLLQSITDNVSRGTILLVVDSASDISEFSIGSSGRKWPIWMILDMSLLGIVSPLPAGQGGRKGRAKDGVEANGEGDGEWELVEGSDSRWYRLPPGTGNGWPTKLENTRYWYRVYRRL